VDQAIQFVGGGAHLHTFGALIQALPSQSSGYSHALDLQLQARGALQGRLLAAVGGLALLGHFILLNKNKENFLAKNSSTGLIDGAVDSLLSI